MGEPVKIVLGQRLLWVVAVLGLPRPEFAVDGLRDAIDSFVRSWQVNLKSDRGGNFFEQPHRLQFLVAGIGLKKELAEPLERIAFFLGVCKGSDMRLELLPRFALLQYPMRKFHACNLTTRDCWHMVVACNACRLLAAVTKESPAPAPECQEGPRIVLWADRHQAVQSCQEQRLRTNFWRTTDK